eukprot:g905.t1
MASFESAITSSQVRDLNAALGDPPRIRELLANILVSKSSTFNADTENTKILTDIYFYAFAFAKTNSFSLKKVSTFLTILQDIVERDLEGGMKSVDKSFERLQKHLLRLSLDRPPISYGIFTPLDARNIVSFMMENYYRQFKVYHTCFTPKTQLVLKQVLPNAVRQPKKPRALQEGLLVDETK